MSSAITNLLRAGRAATARVSSRASARTSRLRTPCYRSPTLPTAASVTRVCAYSTAPSSGILRIPTQFLYKVSQYTPYRAFSTSSSTSLTLDKATVILSDLSETIQGSAGVFEAATSLSNDEETLGEKWQLANEAMLPLYHKVLGRHGFTQSAEGVRDFGEALADLCHGLSYEQQEALPRPVEVLARTVFGPEVTRSRGVVHNMRPDDLQVVLNRFNKKLKGRAFNDRLVELFDKIEADEIKDPDQRKTLLNRLLVKTSLQALTEVQPRLGCAGGYISYMNAMNLYAGRIHPDIVQRTAKVQGLLFDAVLSL